MEIIFPCSVSVLQVYLYVSGVSGIELRDLSEHLEMSCHIARKYEQKSRQWAQADRTDQDEPSGLPLTAAKGLRPSETVGEPNGRAPVSRVQRKHGHYSC
jgi:hypothetical protein